MLAAPGERKPMEIGGDELAMLKSLRPFVRQSGDDLRRAWFMKGRVLLDYLVVGIGSGNGVFTVGDSVFPVGRGDIVWIPPSTFHEMSGTSRSMRCAYIHFDLVHDWQVRNWDACIPGGTLDLSAYKELAQSGRTGTAADSWQGRLPLSNSFEAMALIRGICAERLHGGAGFNLAAAGMLLQLLAVIARGLSSASERAAVLTQRASEAILAGDCGCGMKVSKMAKLSALSQTQFRRLYRAATGQRPKEALLNARMRKACELLVYSGMNVSEVSAALGYSNVHNFSRAFAREAGMPPSKYRRS